MSAWNFMSYDSKDNVLAAVRRESSDMFALAEDPGSWEAPTGAGHWQVRDIFGHLIDTTETYFTGFDAARGAGEGPPLVPLAEMAVHVDRGAQAFRSLEREEALDRLRAALERILAIEEGLSEEDWNLLVPHKYMGPLPAFFYPVFQLVDYAVHSWDIREGSGKPHALEGRSVDLLVPLCFVLWTATAKVGPETKPMDLGVRILSGENAGETRICVRPEGLTTSTDSIGDVPTTIDFDPASFVLTAYGRMNAGTVHGDRDLGHAFLDGFFRI
ncbi:maleylpyruvate isomerase N-terminal domain-containing protein [Nocardioides pyridinolyticus]